MIAEGALENPRPESIFGQHVYPLLPAGKVGFKPGMYMANKAKSQFPDIDFGKSIMVGDTNGDMLFGKNAGMTTVYVGLDHDIINTELIDYRFKSLAEFAESLSANDCTQ